MRTRHPDGRAATIATIWRERAALTALARYDAKRAYAGSGLGAAWTVLLPAVPFVVLAVVFSAGLGATLGGLPYLYGFASAYLPWLLLSTAVLGATPSLLGHRHLVRRGGFPLAVVPVSPVLLACLPHVVLGALTIAGCLLGGRGGVASLAMLPVLWAGTVLLAVGVGLALAPLTVLVRDLAQVVPIGLQIWFWLTPVAWSSTELAPGLRRLLAANPAAYLTDGYRHALLPGAFAAPSPGRAVAFWLVTASLLATGSATFGRLRHHLWEWL